MGVAPKTLRIVILWDSAGIKVQGNGATHPETIAALEMAKALIMGQTIGHPTTYGGPGQGQITQAKGPAIGRQVDREVS